MANESEAAGVADNGLTWEAFSSYMDNFKRDLTDTFSNREACRLRHEALDKQLKDGSGNFDSLNKRIATIERNMFIGMGVLAAFEFALRMGWLDKLLG